MNNTRRVCIVMPDGWDIPSGLYTSVRRIVGLLQSPPYQIDVLSVRFDRSFASGAIGLRRGPKEEFEFAVGVNNDPTASNALCYTRLLSFVKERGHDCLHLFYLGRVAFIANRVARELGIPCIASARGSDVERGCLDPLGTASLVDICRDACVVTCVSNRLRHILGRLFARDYRLIYNSLVNDAVAVQKVRGICRKTYFVCDMSDPLKKGLPVLLDALSLTTLPKGWLVFLTGISEGELGVWKQRYHPRNSVSVAKSKGVLSRPEFLDLLRNASGFIQASFQEGCPNSLIEALALGCPIVSTRAGAAPEILREGIDALFYDSWQSIELSRHLTSIVTGDSDGDALAQNARVYAASVLSSERERQEWLAVYAEAVG